MAEENSPIAIIPSESFRWRARVQFVQSFRTRAAALNFAFQNECNLIVEHNEGRSLLFDVLQDPDGACTAGLNLELLKTEDVLVEPPPAGWTALMFQTIWNLAGRFATLVVSLCTREIVPLSRRVIALARTYLREIVPLYRRAAVIASTYLQEIGPIYRRAVASMYLRDIVPLYRRASAIASTYLREVAPFYRRTTAFASLYLREIAPTLRHAATKCWSDSKSASGRRSLAIAAVNHSDPSRLR